MRREVTISSLSDLHNVLNVSRKDRILNNIKDYFNILSVRCRGEMAIKLLGLVLPNGVEHAHHETLHVFKPVWVPGEIWEVVADAAVLDLVYEEIRLVEKEDDRYTAEAPVVDDRVKDIDAFHQTVGDAVLKEGLVEGTGGDEEQDGGDFIKALEPLVSLGTLPAHVNKAEGDPFDVNEVFVDAASSFT